MEQAPLRLIDIVELGFVGGVGYRLIERQNALIAGRRGRADPAAARPVPDGL
jgi:hypothetical protein